jgi:uncharacterized membrane protein
MQQYSTHRSSSAPLLLAAVGVGALVAYVLSSPRRRAALLSASQSALDAGSRLAASSAERLHDMMPEPIQDSMQRWAARARNTSDTVTSAAADKLNDAVDRASELMHNVVARARRLPARAHRNEALQDLREGYDDALDSGNGRSSARGVIIAAAAVGAGLYAMQRYGVTERVSERVRQRVGADDDGHITLDKTVFIDAPIEQVFDTWADCENFPRFMSNVKSVSRLDGQRSHWTIRGPAGVGVEFDALTHTQRPTELAWESEAGSRVQCHGRVTLVPEGSGTRATVRMTYRPPAGALGHTVSSLLGANPKTEFADDLDRMKQFIEERRTSTPPVDRP